LRPSFHDNTNDKAERSRDGYRNCARAHGGIDDKTGRRPRSGVIYYNLVHGTDGGADEDTPASPNTSTGRAMASKVHAATPARTHVPIFPAAAYMDTKEDPAAMSFRAWLEHIEPGFQTSDDERGGRPGVVPGVAGRLHTPEALGWWRWAGPLRILVER